MKVVLARLLLALVAALPSARSATVADTRAGTGQPGTDGDGGPALRARLNNPFGVVRGPDGALWFCEYDGQVVRRIDRDGTITTVAGDGRAAFRGDGGPAREASLHQPHEIRFDRDGNLFIADMRNHAIRRVDARTRVITTVAGTGQPGYSGDGGPGARAQLRQPHSLQFDATGNLFIGDLGNHVIRRLDGKTGVLTTFAGTGRPGPTPDGAPLAGTPLNGPRSLDFDRDGHLWLATREGNQVFRIDPVAGRIHHLAGTGAKGFTGHGGPAREATLSGPKGIAMGPDGRVYLADTESHSIRRLDPRTGLLDVVVGTGVKGDGPDGDPRRCQLARPHGIWVDPDGTLFIGDSENHRIRRVRLAER